MVKRAIKVVFTDVDGVLTDGGMYYGPSGEVMKLFNTRDGMGVARLRKAGIQTVIVTQENTEIVQSRAAKLGIEQCFQGIMEKAATVLAVCTELGIEIAEAAYIGDDVNDLRAMRLVGVSAAPADAEPEVLAAATFVCKCSGGRGAFREFAEYLMRENCSA